MVKDVEPGVRAVPNGKPADYRLVYRKRRNNLSHNKAVRSDCSVIARIGNGHPMPTA
jgi:hypothetical protein